MFATCSVEYDGRAYSTLQTGEYLIVYKKDKSMMIHGSDLITPLNYIGNNSNLNINNNILIFTRKSEKILITINEIKSMMYLDNWSNNKITISRTEKELVDKICDNWTQYFDNNCEKLHREYMTELGPIDIFGYSKDLSIIIEVKRKRASTKDVSQLKRYVEAITAVQSTDKIIGYIAAPDISDKAIKYLEKSGLFFLEVKF